MSDASFLQETTQYPHHLEHYFIWRVRKEHEDWLEGDDKWYLDTPTPPDEYEYDDGDIIFSSAQEALDFVTIHPDFWDDPDYEMNTLQEIYNPETWVLVEHTCKFYTAHITPSADDQVIVGI